MRVSVLGVVDVEAAALVGGVSPTEVRALVSEAEVLGLLARPDRESAHRFHPLVRDFLHAKLLEEVGEQTVRDLHLQVALSSEKRNWVLSAWHYRAAGHRDDAARLVDGAVRDIIAAGSFELAAPFLDGSAGPLDRPVAVILRSRLDFVRGEVRSALALAALGVEISESTPFYGTALLNLAGLRGVGGYSDSGEQLARTALATELSASERVVAEAIISVRGLTQDGDLSAGAELLRGLAKQQAMSGQSRYAAITLLYASATMLWLGHADEALAAANEAYGLILTTGRGGLEVTSVLEAQATALMYLGRADEARAVLTTAGSAGRDFTLAEVAIETARLEALLGSRTRAEAALAPLERDGLPDAYRGIHASISLTLALRVRNLSRARSELRALLDHPPTEIAGTLQVAIWEARTHLLVGSSPRATLERARALARTQGTEPGLLMVELLSELAADGPVDVPVTRVSTRHGHCLSTLAEEISENAHRLSVAALERVRTEIAARPERWREALWHPIASDSPAAVACASLLAGVGEPEQAAELRALAAKAKKLRPAAVKLTERLAAPVHISDLGIVSVSLGGQSLRIVRRKVLGLLAYLVTRPDLAATRDEILEALWADLSPETAGNSLHQTIYFLRRIFEPDFREGLSAGYVTYDGEVVSLDASRITSASRACWSLLRAPTASTTDVRSLLTLYTGKFALDFAYEDWAADYRDTLHAAILSAVEAEVVRAVQRKDFDFAIWCAQRLLSLDPEADGVEVELLRAYKASGRASAAAEQYAHYSTFLREDLGVEPPRLEEL